MEEKCRIYNGECFEIMQALIDEGIMVDAVICDPPYMINYADWDKEFDMPLAIDMCYALLKDNGNCILFQGWSNVAKAKGLLDNKFKIQNWIVWDRIKGRGAKKNLISTREDILWYCKGDNPTYKKSIQTFQRKLVVWERKMGKNAEH